MKAPVATYRVQLNKNFDFASLKAIVPYLEKFGVSHIYSSPIFKAKSESMHGYDIIDSNKINDELGGPAGFEDLAREVAAYGLGWMQDIVPNHVSYSLENHMIYDLMEKGTGSKYHSFFDVDWNYPSARLRGRLLAPFLANRYRECLAQGELSLVFNEGFKIRYKSTEFPINNNIAKLNNAFIEDAMDEYNNNPESLDKLLSSQIYALSHWKTALKKINYRRFLDIIELIGIRIEHSAVFQETHRLILQLLALGKISALRIDHIDGLFKPEEYIERLRELLPDTYIVVEKILTDNEKILDTWRVQGTTGYDFIDKANGLFVKKTSEQEIDDFYKQFTGNTENFSDLLYKCKKFIIGEYFLGDVRNLARLINQSLDKVQYGGNVSHGKMMQTMIELLACFPVYRTYMDERNLRSSAKDPFRLALKAAKEKNRQLLEEISATDYLLEQCDKSNEALHAIMRLQQFTGSIMAKGFEDTALYRYNRFLSLNEVGGNPNRFGCSIEEFHEFNELRQKRWPLSLNAMSTHDTKRGEDVRARLNIISEIPLEFRLHVEKWAELNASKKKTVNGELASVKNEEFYLYQTLLGAFPFDREELKDFADRLQAHMVKALREAKKQTSWISPQIDYEETVTAFAVEVLNNEPFLEDFLPFQKKIAHYGFFNSLGQTLLKVTCPGIPDFYQGTELWDLNLVDPDNRRLVDFQKRQRMLAEVSSVEPSKAKELLDHFDDGKAKLYVAFRALQFRKRIKELFEQGAYVPLTVKGPLKEHVIAFCRQKGSNYVLVVVPRFLTNLIRAGETWELGIEWVNTAITLPQSTPLRWSEVFTGKLLFSKSEGLPVKEVLGTFPVALLFSGETDD